MSISAVRRALDARMGSLAVRFGGQIPAHIIAAPIFIVLCAMAAVTVIMATALEVKAIKTSKLEDISKWRNAATTALSAINERVTAAPCSPKFQEQVRGIAFWPDGLNEFLYLPQDTILCSAAVLTFSPAVDLGRPDVKSRRANFDLWIERDLAAIGLAGSRGSILRIGSFATVLPNVAPAVVRPSWVSTEVVALMDDTSVVSISGSRGLFSSLRGGNRPVSTYLTSGVTCSHDDEFCVAAAIDVWVWARHHIGHMAIGLVILTFLAYLITFLVADHIRTYFSFGSRMVRNLSSETIVVAYQPIYDLADRRISGVEALVRFRDVDGSIVYPDKFIDLVLDTKKTIELTRLVAEAVKTELNRHWTFDTDLQVNVNIFPRDLGSEELLKTCESFLEDCNPCLKLAVEVIEDEAIEKDELATVVAKLHDKGIKVYIDDFGSGYSSVESVSTLPVDGIKLDRSFAMAPPDSVMGRMFLKVIELLKTTGKPLVIEGIEDVSKMGVLRSGELARYAQGYGIGRPMPIEDFIKLAESPPALTFNCAA